MARSTLLKQIYGRQFKDEGFVDIHYIVLSGDPGKVTLDSEGVLRLDDHICVPRVDDFIQIVFQEAHSFSYSIIRE